MMFLKPPPADVRLAADWTPEQKRADIMDIIEKKSGQARVLELNGRLDATTSPMLDEALNRAVDEANYVVIDFSDLSYISSAGLRTILSGAKKVQKKKGELRLAALDGMVKEVFQLAGFYDMLPVYETQDLALEGLA
jgi:anti-anti-sigma factor